MNSANAAAEAESSNRVTRAPDAEVHLGDCEGGGGQDAESSSCGDTDDAGEASEKEYSTSEEEYSTSEEESEISDTDSEPASPVPRTSFTVSVSAPDASRSDPSASNAFTSQ